MKLKLVVNVALHSGCRGLSCPVSSRGLKGAVPPKEFFFYIIRKPHDSAHRQQLLSSMTLHPLIKIVEKLSMHSKSPYLEMAFHQTSYRQYLQLHGKQAPFGMNHCTQMEQHQNHFQIFQRT